MAPNGGTMGALRIEKKTSDLENLSPPPSSAPVSGVAVPPPPAQLVNALAEYETRTRESFPSFTELAPSSTTSASAPDANQARADEARNRPSLDARTTGFRVAAVAIAAMSVIAALVALFFR
jgi:hypothetical protein